MRVNTSFYVGSHASKLFEELLLTENQLEDATPLSVLCWQNQVLVKTLEKTYERMSHHQDDRRITFHDVMTKALKKVSDILPDNAAVHVSAVTDLFTEILNFADILFIDADFLDTAQGQWLIQSAKVPVWAIGMGMHNSPMASLYLTGIIYPVHVGEILDIIDMVHRRNVRTEALAKEEDGKSKPD